MTRRPRRERPASEHALVPPVRAHLEAQGYRVWSDPDRSDYFDLAAKRGEEVGLVELKIADGPAVLAQALARRAWADWVAVALASRRSAERIFGSSRGSPSARVGIWLVEGAGVEVLRRALPRRIGEDDPHADARRRLRGALERLESGELAPEVGWSGLPQAIRRASGGRRFREWTIEELVEEAPTPGGPPRDCTAPGSRD